MKMNECILYRLREEDQILKDMDFLIENYENSYYNREDMKGLFYTCVGKLLDLSVSHGFTGNLWQDYLTYIWSAMRMVIVRPVRLWEKWKAVSMRLHCMIFVF